MKVITSRENNLYKQTAKLLRKKSRDETGQYLLEGTKPLRDALEMGLMIEKIFARQGVIPDAGIPEEKLVFLDPKLFDHLSDTVHSQGIIAVVRRQAPDPEGFLEQAQGPVLVLDRVQDPGNAGTMIRTAEAAGFGGVIALSGSADLFSPKVVRSAAGSLLRLPVLTDVTARQLTAMARGSGRKLMVTALEDAEDCFRTDQPLDGMLVIGNEGSGVCEELIAAADVRLTIPMEGKIESLNAAVAAGILMYQINHRNRGR
ncbi:MAG: RNA methyltransferase [Firmicutes bacterium]|nr:RNA methyltransferase [Bacillota bacterium]